jgi:hypothetical protein
MSFAFEPMSEEQIKALNFMEEGEYSFEVTKATQKTSKSGNPMIELQLKIWERTNGGVRIIFDYLVSTKNMLYKIKHFCDSVGLDKEYLSGSFEAEDCIGKMGMAYIILQKGQPKEGGGNYPDKNAVQDYIVNKSVNHAPVSKTKESFTHENDLFDHDIPF